GGLGNDLVNGQDGDDVLYGGDGNDGLSGDLRIVPLTGFFDTREFSGAGGNDVLDGGTGDDELQGGEGDDVMFGGAGDDAVFGEYNWRDIAPLDPLAVTINSLTGNDVMDGGDGNDNLYGGRGDEVLYGGAGIDFLEGGEGNDTLFGGAGDDLLDAGFGDNILFGEAGNDRLLAHEGHDVLYGGEGDDYLSGADGSTNVIGDAVLDGGSGNDTYVVDNIGDLVIEAADSGTDTVKSFINYTLPDAVENLIFDDSNVLLTDSNTHGIGNALDNVLSGGTSLEGLAGDDTLIGKGWLDGGTGDDILNGGSTLSFLDSDGGQHVIGNTYIFAAGYGHDTIQEYDADFFNSASYGNEDTLRFLAEITPTDVTWQRQGNDLLLSVNDGADLVTVRSYFDLLFRQGSITALGVTPPPQGFIFSEVGAPFYVAPSRIETVRFADGTAWGADRFGAPLLGDTQSDTYQFGIGTGQMTILDFDWRASSEGRSGNRDSIQVNSGVLPDDLVASRVNGNDLILSINGSTDQVTVQSFFTQVFITTFFTGRDVHPYEIEQIQFADGTVWNWNDLNNRIMSISGTEQADDLFGNDNDNVMHGLGGDDFIAGGQGNDVLDGGFGNDQLYGYEGNDTYLFGRGDGQDMVQNYDYTGADVDILKLGPDIAPSDVTVQVGEDDPADLVLKLNGTTDEITIDDFLYNERYRLDRIEFSDGISWDANAILAHGRGVDLVGTENADELEGSPFSDTLAGLGADDELAGSIGDDRLDGGAGDDILAGDEGNDTYLFQDEFGHDTIHEHDSAGTAVDTILFTGSVTPNDVTVRATVFDGLVLGVNGSTDDILIDRFLSDRQYAIEVVQFADGTLWDLNSLLARGQGFDRTGT
ncbi:MAG TPA: calcium-binding protein, partial [Nitrospira sp.]|nr:calcium-binding protein [Nitrospira sp.]